jgi:glycine/D-amino acid oxidase-like deaminating enzyme
VKIGIAGGGIFGVASALELARRGHTVELFERSTLPAPDASSTDISKAIRMEYGAATALYAPMVERALARWRQVEQAAGRGLLHLPGVLFLASAFDESRFEWQSVEALRARGHRPEVLEARDARRRWPQFSWDGLCVGVYNPEGGWLEASAAVLALAELARAAGAKLLEGQRVEGIDEGPAGAGLWVGGERRRFDAALVCAGPWVSRLLPQLGGHARVSRQHVSLWRPADAAPFHGDAFPVWIHDMLEEGWYGFPASSQGIVKISLHRRSETVQPDAAREGDPSFLAAARQFVRRSLPALDPASPLSGRVCLYTSSPRGDLVFDRVPDASRLYVAGLGSGHGFKFGPVLGELAADMLERDDVPAALRLGAVRDDEVW